MVYVEREPQVAPTPVLSFRRALLDRALWRWLLATSFVPDWLPPRWRSLPICCGLAAIATLTGVMATYALTTMHPGFAFRGVFAFAVTVLVAFSMGSGPGLLSAVIAALLVGAVLVPRSANPAMNPLVDAGAVIAFILVSAAIIVLVSQERALRRYAEAAARALQATSRQRDAFISIAGHELRAPLTSVIGSLQLAQRQADLLEAASAAWPEERERLGQLQSLQTQAIRASWQMNRLIADLLDTSRVQADRFEVLLAPADLRLIVEEVVRDRRLATADRAIDLCRTEGVNYAVEADADRIAQVLTNFLTNADRYSPSGTPITVEIAAAEQSLRVAVTDKGPGVPPHDQERIWEPYARGTRSSGTGATPAGLGIGLFISKAIIVRHGGQIGVESPPGRGATFWFTLPRATWQRKPAKTDESGVAATPGALDAGMPVR